MIKDYRNVAHVSLIFVLSETEDHGFPLVHSCENVLYEWDKMKKF